MWVKTFKKSLFFRTKNSTGVHEHTVAVRGISSVIAYSPNNIPGPICPMN